MAKRKSKGEGFDWIEFLAAASRLIGLSPVRTRWKLRAWRDRVKAQRRLLTERTRGIAAKNKVCPRCGEINAVDAKVCLNCSTALRSRPMEVLNRFLRRFSLGATPETFLATAMIVVYAVTVIKGQSSTWMSAGVMDLLHLGANSATWTVQAGEFWRLLTAVFLHGGLLHLGLNLFALIYIMPVARDVYGDRKAMVVFVVSGVFASLTSVGWQLGQGHAAVSIGASGAISGVIGLMLAWGHRDGTAFGLSIRNSMLRWVLYTALYGFAAGRLGPGVDNAAHIGGWAIGAALAYTLPTGLTAGDSRLWSALSTAAWLAVVAALGLICYFAFFVPFPTPILPN
jgi:rhomboid protease GluP